LWAELTATERASIKAEVATLGKQLKGEA
jgi:hypothetical protein